MTEQITEPGIDNVLRSLAVSLAAKNLSPATVRQYNQSVRKFNGWLGGQAAFPAGVRREHVVGWLAALNADPALQSNSVRHYFAGLRAFFNWFELEPECPKNWQNPTYKVRAPKETTKLKDYVSPEDIERAIKTLEAKKTRTGRVHAAVVAVLSDTGMRASSVCELRTVDFDLEAQEIVVRKTKNREEYAVVVSMQTAVRLDRVRRDRLPGEYDWLLPGQHGQFTPSGIHQLVKKAFKAIGIEGVGPHDLRHSFASQFLESGGSTDDLQTIGNWKDATMPRRYARASQARRGLSAQREFFAKRRVG